MLLETGGRYKNHAEQKLLRLPVQNIYNGTLVGEVLKSRCSSSFAKNMCVSDLLGKKSREKVYRLEKNRGWSVGVFRPLSIPASGTSSNTNVSAANTEKCLFECTVNEESVRTPCKNRFTSTNTTLPVISVEKLKRRALFVARIQRVCVHFHVQHMQPFSYSKVCSFQMGSSNVSQLRDNHLGHYNGTSKHRKVSHKSYKMQGLP